MCESVAPDFFLVTGAGQVEIQVEEVPDARLNEAEWAQVFEGYKAIPQYRELNAGMSLSEFKTIFWWEWSHRLLGRVIGAVYLLPFLFFLWRGALSAELKRRLWLIFGLGALQGAVG